MLISTVGKKVSAHSYGKNSLRSKDFITIKHKIQTCEKDRHILSLKQLVEKYAEQNFDGQELLDLYNNMEQKLVLIN